MSIATLFMMTTNHHSSLVIGNCKPNNGEFLSYIRFLFARGMFVLHVIYQSETFTSWDDDRFSTIPGQADDVDEDRRAKKEWTMEKYRTTCFHDPYLCWYSIAASTSTDADQMDFSQIIMRKKYSAVLLHHFPRMMFTVMLMVSFLSM
jgi:hypothetical protein